MENTLMGLLRRFEGIEPAPVVKQGDDLTTVDREASEPEVVDLNLETGEVDHLDHLDRQNTSEEPRRGRFEIGETVTVSRVDSIHPLSAGDRAATELAGFPRAGCVVAEGVGLLADDVLRAFRGKRFLVLGFVDIPRAGNEGVVKR